MKIYVPLSLSAIALLGACASSDPVTPAPAPVIVTTPAPVVTAPPPVVVASPATVRAGWGRIESISALPPSAVAGGTAKPLRRVGLRMDDGTVQYVDTAAEGIALGDRVELTGDLQLRR